MNTYSINRILIEKGSQGSTITNNVLSKFPYIVPEIIDESDLGNKSASLDKSVLILTKNKGKFLKACPGTKEYLCCLYNFLNVAQNCPINCTYCILQIYLNSQALLVYVNQDDLIKELRHELADKPELIRIGTGELTDSLALDPICGINEGLIEFFSQQDQAFLELKTKSHHIDHLIDLPVQRQIIISWSLNPEYLVETEEQGASTITQRLHAARECQKKGIKIGFHLDPILLYPGWEEAYHKLIVELSEYIDLSKTVWISMGCFRFMPDLKRLIKTSHPQSEIIYQEFIPGMDKKMRYLQPMRIKAYHSIASWIFEKSKDAFIYLCMESPFVWQEALGHAPDNNDTLKSWLDQRCYM